MPVETERPTFREAFRFWLKLGFISFGGPTGQIAIMQTELVERNRWISQSHFLHALNFCMLLPGPEATQLAIYIGWLLHKVRGGIVAGALFVIPSIVVLWLLSFIYVAFGAVPWVAAIFYGLKPAVTAIVIVAVIRIGRKALRTPAKWAIAAAAFAAIYFFHVPFPAIILGAGLIGIVFGWRHGSSPADSGPSLDESATTESSLGRVLRIVAVCLVLWFAPVVLVGALRGWNSTLFQEGLFFSKAAVVTFGGAYAVLPYVAQQALFHYGWLQPGQMMDGLGLAETTPGPLIMVLQFVGFVGAWQHPEGLPPLVAATIGALLTTWVTFTPCFLWVLAGAPYIERLRDNTRLAAAFSAVTAAVVGVILNLAVWFAAHVFTPAAGHIDWFAIGLCAAALLVMLRFNASIIAVIVGSGLAGLLIQLVR
jgi:chromate transporter